MQSYKLIENKDAFQRPDGTFCYAVVTQSEKSDFELVYRCCDHNHNTVEEAKECQDAIKTLEAGGFDPTGRLLIQKQIAGLQDLVKKFPAHIMPRFDYENKETWPKHASDVLMFAPGTGFCLGEFHIDEFHGPLFCDWNDRASDEEDADYNEVPNVTHYLLLGLPK